MNNMKRTLGTVGIWSMELRGAARPEVREAAAELDQLGFPALWIPGLDGPGALDDVEHLLVAAPRATVALGVLSMWGQDPSTLGSRWAALDSAYGPRAVLGLGVSNAHSAANAGQDYGKPTVSMRRFLDGLDAAPHPIPTDRRLLGALGPKMVDLATARTSGWHPFLVTPEYSAVQRARVGEAPLIAPHLAVVLDRDPSRARAAARDGIGTFIGFPAYRSNLARLGYGEDDLVPGGSDRLIDALVAWGDLDDVADRIQAHLDAGADHVTLHVLRPDAGADLPRQQWRELATLLPRFTPRTPGTE
ncbi:TIGR03620 family F420-dependent LLM class oxidoreductase [Micromonospora parathelypteridis]|uniref:Putative F420-dependent oxidoreductase n=1 Tax=Micromonospora parathelypteridis TaxID=1839617 RepID=A0A840W8A1_9ACTN|nr:TIGR03620 family F420-dependent LLM class oxidoreductase [Micromonospora parathelypteridis]MBB5481258.1 putative F420-dependent oxidoreductase [Micromonospora parathelypteridis]GGO19352.1 LLM class F420-dependent oxidoreductase [Micromonospora parathelypteridis]